jgi:two-component system phosphate regulon sensor histidine kinase PhoR
MPTGARSRVSPFLVAVAPAAALAIVLTGTDHVTPLAGALIVLALAAGGLVSGMLLARPRTSERGSLPPARSTFLLERILEQLPDPVLLINAGREIVAINRSARDVLGVGVLGRDLALSIRHPDVLAAVETLVAGVPSLTEEVTLPLPVPRTFTLYAGTIDEPSPRAGGEDGGGDRNADEPRFVLVFHDETRAKKAEQSRADFVANASHELRSPLSSLIGFIETLRGPAMDDDATRERFLAVMHTEAQRMTRLVEDLMSLSRVEINEHVPPKGLVDLPEILSAVAVALTVRAESRAMTIEVDLPPRLPAVIGDADQLTQVFHNLIDNAVKYARAETPIRIRASTVDRLPGTHVPAVSVSVTDRGEGIPAIHLPRLTERFYRSDEGRSRRLGGTGLGLAIVKHIVSRHRGRLTIESQLGVGSTFTVYLPTPSQATGDATAGAPAQKIRLATVDRHKTVT